MKKRPPIRDTHLTGIDHYAMMVSIVNGTGIGKIPSNLNEVGWFGSKDLTTMLSEIDASSDEYIIKYVKLYPDGSYSYFYDADGETIICTPQSMILSAREMGNPDVINHIDRLEEAIEKAENVAKAKMTTVLINQLLSIDNQEEFERVCTSADLNPNAAINILSDLEAAQLALENHEEDNAVEVVTPYVQRVRDGESVAQVIKSMRSDGVSEFEIMAFTSALEFLGSLSWGPPSNTQDYIN
jgi:hypothetical protein